MALNDKTVSNLAEKGMVPGAVACITGAADGIGLACAKQFAALGLNVVALDINAEKLNAAGAEIARAGAPEVATHVVDVSDANALQTVESDIAARFGGTDILVNNAGIQPGSDIFGPLANWQRIIGVNLWGVINGSQIFAPRMIARGRPGAIINTGSKQGITTPPGDPCYNVAKAGVKAFTEALEHELRNTDGAHLSAHLLIPGFVFTALNAHGRTEKPTGAWTPDQMADFAMQRLAKGDFYILCPDNDVPRDLDEKRMTWAMGDITKNRPPLSRWHPDYTKAFEAYITGQETVPPP